MAGQSLSGRKKKQQSSSSRKELRNKLIGNSDQEDDVIIQLLAKRSCHLPGNSWTQDWIQFVFNNHIILGICCHHKLHPLETWERSIALVGSIGFGLFATNIANMWYIRYSEIADDELYTIPITIPYLDEEFVITKGLVVLWTVGSICHSFFDFSVWHIMACACCHPGGRWGDKPNSEKFKDVGSYSLIPVVCATVALAVITVIMRASWSDTDGQEIQPDDDQIYYEIDTDNIQDVRQFNFLTQYGIELFLAWFVYFPIFGTLLFSGVLGCGRLPILGGRPRDKRLVEQASKGEGAWYMLWGGSPPNLSMSFANRNGFMPGSNRDRVSV